LDSGRLSYGPFLRRFEQDFAVMHGRKFGVSVSSGTSALLVAVQAMKEKYSWKDGDEIIVPAVTFIATSNVVLQNRLKPVFVDIDHKTYNINVKKIEEKINKRTRAIMPVHLFGLSAEMSHVVRLARKHNLKIIEDSCEAAGVNYRGKPVGSMGDVSCFSTYIAHLVTTGVGGVALCNDPDLAVRMRSLVNHGRDSIYIAMDDDRGKSSNELSEVIGKRFSFISIGHSHRMTEMEGALGVAQLKELHQNIKLRQRYAVRFMKGLKSFEKFLQLPVWPGYAEHAFMMFPIVIKDKNISRDELTLHLEQWNIETRPIFPLLGQPVYKKIFGNNALDKYPVAKFINENGFYIGCHPELKISDIDYIVSVFKKFFEKRI